MKLLGHWMLDKSDDSILQGNPITIDFYGLNNTERLDATLKSVREDMELGLSLLRNRWLSVGPIVEKILRKADHIIKDFPNIERDGTVLKIHGKIGVYDVDIIDGTVVLCCLGGHKEFRDPCFCLGTEETVGIDSLPGDDNKRMLIIAINLACDVRILSSVPVLWKLAKCPECLSEGKIGEDIADLTEELPGDADGQVVRYLGRLSAPAWDCFAFSEKEGLFEDVMTRAYTVRGNRFK